MKYKNIKLKIVSIYVCIRITSEQSRRNKNKNLYFNHPQNLPLGGSGGMVRT